MTVEERGHVIETVCSEMTLDPPRTGAVGAEDGNPDRSLYPALNRGTARRTHLREGRARTAAQSDPRRHRGCHTIHEPHQVIDPESRDYALWVSPRYS